MQSTAGRRWWLTGGATTFLSSSSSAVRVGHLHSHQHHRAAALAGLGLGLLLVVFAASAAGSERASTPNIRLGAEASVEACVCLPRTLGVVALENKRLLFTAIT
jgi:hypothetical protein